MKKRILYAATIIALSSMGSSMAQTTGELYNFSNNSRTSASARVAAMGGAFTSLGGDVSSMLINPAGIAMFSNSEATVTPSLFMNQNASNFNGYNSTKSNNTKFGFSNLAGVITTDVGVVIGVGYNRLADFSGKQQTYGTSQSSSINQIYAQQLQGIAQGNIQTPSNDIYKPFFRYAPNTWNAIMAYQTGLVNPMSADDNEANYTTGGLFNGGDTQNPQSYMLTDGAINEFTISGAYNYQDLLYVGVALGFQDMYYNQDYQYSEVYNQTNTGSLQDFTSRSTLRMSGYGFNIKLGATVRPSNWLRLGFAYHSPTWSTMSESSYYDMTVYDYYYDDPAYSDTPELVNDYHFRTPSRLMAGASVAIAGRVIISADYERTNYGDMKMNTNLYVDGYRVPEYATPVDNLPNIADNYYSANNSIELNNIITDYYAVVDNYRLGIEAQPFNGFFVRAGYSYSSSPYKNVRSTIYPENLSDYGAQTLYSGGLGYRKDDFGIDLTYTHAQTKTLPSTYYSYIGTGGVIQPNGFVNNTFSASQVLVTLVFKF